MDPITILLIVGGGLLFASRKRKKYVGSASSKDRPIPPPPETPYVPGELVRVEIDKDRVSAVTEGVSFYSYVAYTHVSENDFPIDVLFYVKGSDKIKSVETLDGKVLDQGELDALVRLNDYSHSPSPGQYTVPAAKVIMANGAEILFDLYPKN